MLEQVKQNIGLVLAIVISSVVLFNVCMMLLHGLLGILKNYTASKWDNKAWKIVGKLINVGQKAIDYSVANKAHKE